jgi:hypothetical protein
MNNILKPFNNKYETGDNCPKSGFWICKDHPSVELPIGEGHIFSRCHHVAGHHAIWWYEVNE